MKKWLLFIVIIFFVSCSNSNKGKKSANEISKEKQLESTIKKNKIFSKKTIVWWHLTEKERDSLEKTMGKDEYNSFEEDEGVYTTDVMSFILDNNIEQYVIQDSALVYNFKLGNEIIKVDRREYFPDGLILFNGKQKPVVTTLADFETEFNKYFR